MAAPRLSAANPPPALGSRALFPELRARAYLNHAGLSPPSVPVQAAVRQVLSDVACRGADAFPDWIAQRERLRTRLATLVDARAKDIALTGGTTRGLIDVSTCLRWQTGTRIIGFAGEFPANITPWQAVTRSSGVHMDLLPLEGFDDESGDGLQRVEDALRCGDVAVVAVSAVQFQTGLRMPLSALSELCHRYGALLSVDGIQAVGAVPLSMRTDAFDILSTGTHKWLMGLDGFGFLALSERALSRMEPRVAGWLSHEDPVRFLFEGPGELRYDRPIRSTADFLEVGAWPTVGFAALEAALMLLETLGVPAIYAHIQRWHDLAEPLLVSRGFESLRSPIPDRRSGLLCLRPPAHLKHSAIVSHLSERGIAIANPDGNLRIAPHWPNHTDEVGWVMDALDELTPQNGA